ncbi:methyltransferase type 11 [Haloferula helveola]|uniref:Methyltransferase type 11 n=1 Tax=Haloferula helveola TaxID=490095 RepID=A0ABM7RA44_9BACT|nr:methyltransferase type 11 [Haloferula helveola]
MPAPDRTRFAGMLAIVRYNWPFYLVATLVLVAATILIVSVSNPWIFWASMAAALGSLWFLAGSLVTSHWVYDRSPLYRWDWLRGLSGDPPPKEAIVCVSGFDEASEALGAVMPETSFTVLDHYDADRMTEASIHRARRAFPPGPDALAAPFDRWPEIHADLIVGPLSIHELRSDAERATWFSQAKDALNPGGRIVIVEHVRDLANFIAFGPGFMHFHPASSWQACWESAGLEPASQFRITPFVRVFVLQ